jgi:hypothetical protein
MKTLVFSILMTGLAVSPVAINKEEKKMDNQLNQIDSLFNVIEHIEKKVDTKIQSKAIEFKEAKDSLKEVVDIQKKELKNLTLNPKVIHDTIIIHDTVRVEIKKSFWGKTKIDTTKTN